MDLDDWSVAVLREMRDECSLSLHRIKKALPTVTPAHSILIVHEPEIGYTVLGMPGKPPQSQGSEPTDPDSLHARFVKEIADQLRQYADCLENDPYAPSGAEWPQFPGDESSGCGGRL